MTAGEISDLVVAVVAVLTALAAWLRGHAAAKTARAASDKLDAHLAAQPPAAGQEAAAAAAERLAQIQKGADPLTGCMPVTAPEQK